MKRLLPILLFLITTSIFAQQNRGDRHKEIKVLKIAFITEKLDLTEDEAQKFWPIYNAHEEEKHKHFESSMKKRKDLDIEKLSESEAEALLKEMQANEEAKVKSEKAFIEKLSKVISYKKIVKLMHAERTFKRKMIEEFRGRHREIRKD